MASKHTIFDTSLAHEHQIKDPTRETFLAGKKGVCKYLVETILSLPLLNIIVAQIALVASRLLRGQN